MAKSAQKTIGIRYNMEDKVKRDFDNPVDHPFDLGFVNFVQHPSNANYVVFRFGDQNRANDFEEALKAAGIWYERDVEMKRTVEIVMFGIHKTDFKKAQKINFAVEGKHKKPIIPFKALRYGILVVGLGLLILATIGYCKAQNRLRILNESNSSLVNTQ